MPNIKPILDLIYYNEVLRDIPIGEPVFLTKNGRGKYAIIDANEYENLKASLKLMSQLAQGKQARKEKGWMTIDELESEFGIENVNDLLTI